MGKLCVLSIFFVTGTTLAELARDGLPNGVTEVGFAGFSIMLLWMLWKKGQRQDKYQEEYIQTLVRLTSENVGANLKIADCVNSLVGEMRKRPCLKGKG